VFCFFGLVAVCGTTYVQVGAVTGPSLVAGVAVGALACAILVANNLRDIPTDELAGKRTLAVVLGDRGTRWMYVALLVAGFVLLAVLAVRTPTTALGLVALPLAVRAAGPVLAGAVGRDLVPVLRDTGLAELAWAAGVAVGLALGAV
jgi:1,4-dihydroxy-2-naphthoate octaprenyltransferase